MARIVESTSQRCSQVFFKICGPEFLVQFTKALTERTTLLEQFDTPVRHFYGAYFLKYIGISILLKNTANAERFSRFITFICDNTIDREKSNILEYLLLKELAKFVDDIDVKGCSKSLNRYLEHNVAISENLYKFIKGSVKFKNNDDKDDDMIKQSNGSTDMGLDEIAHTSVLDALVCILRIAVEKKEQSTLDKYGELMLKLYDFMCSRVDKLISVIRQGDLCPAIPIDRHLPRLMSLYMDNQEVIRPYLCYDLCEKISHAVTMRKNLGGDKREDVKLMKKEYYNDIKSGLDTVRERDDGSDLVYQTFINRQYTSVMKQALAPIDVIKRENTCCAKILRHQETILEVSVNLFLNCDDQTYSRSLEKVLVALEQCDALDHQEVLYLLLILESLVLRSTKDSSSLSKFKESMPRTSCSLIRISKLVELGPSIHSFTNPGKHKSVGALKCCTYSNCIKIFSLIFRRHSSDSIDVFITDAMQLCVSSNLIRYAQHISHFRQQFIQLSTSIVDLLKSICMGRKQEDALKCSMPIFLSVFLNLIKCVILASNKQELEALPNLQTNGHGKFRKKANSDRENLEVQKNPAKDDGVSCSYEAKLEHLARDVGRLMNNLSFLESKLVDYAPYLISSYIKDSQLAPCPDSVKRHLDEGVFRIFNLIDAYQKERREQVIEAGLQRKISSSRAAHSLFDMVYARLDQASREIFKNMHDNYNRFHRYQGRC